MSSRPVRITAAPLDIGALAAAVGGPGDGAVVTFAGLVRHENVGKRVLFLDYEAYEPLAAKTLDLIVAEAQDAWPDTHVLVQHRVGRLEIGEISVAIAAASPHRANAYAACRYTIERVKQIVPIWKREHFEGGRVWLEGARADPADTAARESAHRTACA